MRNTGIGGYNARGYWSNPDTTVIGCLDESRSAIREVKDGDGNQRRKRNHHIHNQPKGSTEMITCHHGRRL